MVGEDYSKAANAVGGRTARACDSCLRRRARWFCAADDAFLCQPCDASVHGANQLAARHHRVRLRTSSFKPEDRDHLSSPAWHRGFTRKPRTPRRHKQQAKGVGGEITAPNGFLVDYPSLAVPFVPEMSGEEEEEEEEESPIVDQLIVDEEGLLYQVPVFDPFAADEPGNLGQHPEEADDDDEFDHHILGFLDSELDLAEFAADVESLLGVEDKPCRRLDDVMGCKEEEGKEGDFGVGIDIDVDLGQRLVKVEEDIVDQSVLLGFQQNPSLSPETPNRPSDMLLALNYEAVIAAWDEQGSPWMTGIRPDVMPEHGWPDCVDLSPAEFRHTNNGDWGLGHNGIPRNFGEGREARVSRYREKRRTRLFSKKIRYEVRKLNAEKRPRMKGRFVKRSSTNNNNGNNKPTSTMIGSSTFPHHFMNK